MNPLLSLIEEHRFITRLVDALDAYALRIRLDANANVADVRKFAAAFMQFADELHHEKEERILLPFLVRHGFDWHAPPLPRVRQEHRHESYLLEVLAQAGERLQDWTAEERRHVSATAKALCDFQRVHHATENDTLFPEVSSRLPEEVLNDLGRELVAFDEVPSHRERRAAALALGSELIARYG